MNHAIGLSNLTSLDKSRPGVVNQEGAFTVMELDEGASAIKELSCENITVTRFHIIMIRGNRRFRFLRWLATKLG